MAAHDDEIDLERSPAAASDGEYRRMSTSEQGNGTGGAGGYGESSSDNRRGNDDYRDRDDGSENKGNNLYVSGLSHRTRDEDLEREFSRFGKITKCAVVYDPHTKESRGFAFVSFEDVKCAAAARDTLSNSLELHGKIIRVELAKRARAREPTPGQYNGPPKRDGKSATSRPAEYRRRDDRGGRSRSPIDRYRRADRSRSPRRPAYYDSRDRERYDRDRYDDRRDRYSRGYDDRRR
ncbi:hypothetical protein DFJ73DRAFT_843678 [Zopfochytrium polystomum]|nr:hypothetical protein DFJ73DRAFT_843678 [Zopfochytrium polystomum]